MSLRKWIIRDYIQGYRWVNIKRAFDTDYGWFSLIYFTAIMPFIMDLHETKNGLLVYYVVFFNVVFHLITGNTHSVKLPKQMFLCPIDEAMRKQYITKSVLFRIISMVVLTAISSLIFVLNGFCSWTISITLILSGVVSAVANCGFDSVFGIDKNDKWKCKYKRLGIYELVLFFAVAISVIVMVAYMCEWGNQGIWWVELLFLGTVLFIELPITIKHFDYWKSELEKSLNYEASYLGK